MSKRKQYSKEDLLKKIRKLEKILQYSSESSSDSEIEARATTDTEDFREVYRIVEDEPQTQKEQEEGEPGSDEKQEDLDEKAEEPLSESVINVLGDDGVSNDEALNCLPELALRWENILKSGLKTETKNVIESKYRLLSNCPSLAPPKLNIEIKAAVSEGALKRDLKIVEEQKQIATIITSLGLAMTGIIKENPHNIQVLEFLSDSARLLCNMHFDISKNRRNILASGLNRDVKDLTVNSPIESLLFGNDFADKIKASQAAKKLSAQGLKATVPTKMTKDRPKQNLNYRGPLRHQAQAPARQSGQKSSFPRQPPKSSGQQPRPSKKHHPQRRR